MLLAPLHTSQLDAHQNRLLSVDLIAQFFSLVNYMCLGIFGFFTMNLCAPPGLREYWSGPCGDDALPDAAHYLMVGWNGVLYVSPSNRVL